MCWHVKVIAIATVRDKPAAWVYVLRVAGPDERRTELIEPGFVCSYVFLVALEKVDNGPWQDKITT